MNKLFSKLTSTKCFTTLNAYNKIYSLILDTKDRRLSNKINFS